MTDDYVNATRRNLFSVLHTVTDRLELQAVLAGICAIGSHSCANVAIPLGSQWRVIFFPPKSN